MRIFLTSERTLAAVLASLAILFLAHRASSQDFCPGDLDHDGVVTAADVAELLPLLFLDPFSLDIDTLVRADVNDDATLSAADVAAIFTLDGMPCPPPLPTSTVTPTPTMTLVVTRTPTPTRSPTVPSTPSCVINQAALGATNGTLSQSDCQQVIAGRSRLADVYSISAAPGTAITVEVTTTAPLAGYLGVIDPAGQFLRVDGVSPIQFTTTSTKPYKIQVTSNPASAVQEGDYTLTLTSRLCPTPVVLPIGTARPFSLDGTECPEPGSPSVGTETEPTDVFTFTVTDVPKNISITMQQLSVSETISPALGLLGPDGYEPSAQDDNLDCTGATGTLLCARIRFLALQPGTYTIFATGGGGTGRYSMTVASPTCSPKVLNDIPADAPLNCPGSPSGCTGTLAGDLTHTPCAAPLSSPENPDVLPEPGSSADLYTFTADAGDVISVKMTSSDAPHLYLLGPAPSNRLIAADDRLGLTQLAATLVLPGTYTIIAANDNALDPEDPTVVNYTLLVQKCPVRGGLNLLTGRPLDATFTTLDCRGTRDVPYRSYAFSGQAGQFVSTTMTSSNVDSFVRVFAPDGSRMENDDDPFLKTTDARAGRILPMDGIYFVEASASAFGPPVNHSVPLAFTLRARSCSSTPAAPGQISGAWQDADCDLGVGRTGDVYTFPAGTTPAVATISPPANGCVLALLDDGSQVPVGGCSKGPLDIPVLGSRVHGFIVAGAETSTRGSYTVGLSRCPVNTLSFGDNRHGILDGTNCVDPDGVRADWLLFEAPANVVIFNLGIAGRIEAGFPLGARLSDLTSGAAVTSTFNDDPEKMFSVGDNLAALLRVTGATPADRGAYDVFIDQPTLRE